jgi:hypothetical protein
MCFTYLAYPDATIVHLNGRQSKQLAEGNLQGLESMLGFGIEEGVAEAIMAQIKAAGASGDGTKGSSWDPVHKWGFSKEVGQGGACMATVG